MTFDEIQMAEKAKDDQKRSRAGGFGLMNVRDKGYQRLSNAVVMCWHVDKEAGKQVGGYYRDNGEWVELTTYPRDVPEGKFLLDIKGKILAFDAEEFRRFLRWA